MSLFNRKTVLDDGIESLKINCIDFFDEVTNLHQKFPDPLDIWGGAADKAAETAINASRISADAMVESTDKNIDFQKWLWGEQTDLQQPYMDLGIESIPQYQDLLNQPIDITQDPSYQFRLNEGQKAYENSASASGMTLSGPQVKALNRYGSDYASQEYTNAFNRRQTNLDNFYRMMNLGQAAASGTAQSGTAMGSSVSGSINTAGQSLSDMYQDIGNINAANIQGGTNRNMDIAAGVATLFSDNKYCRFVCINSRSSMRFFFVSASKFDIFLNFSESRYLKDVSSSSAFMMFIPKRCDRGA